MQDGTQRPAGTRRAIGLMSGTSMDGIDIALIETDGDSRLRRGATASVAYPPEFRACLRQAMSEAEALRDRTQRIGSMGEAERLLTLRHAEAVRQFLGQHGLQPAAIDCIGFHGQTVCHRPGGPRFYTTGDGMARSWREGAFTVQLGDGPLLARETGIDVVFDLRAADCEAGGEGAPLVPVYHRALVARLPDRPIAFVNVGGVANVTWIGADGRLIAFDTGPGNALIDDWMQARTGAALDHDGATAARGEVDEDALDLLLRSPYFHAAPPKSLDRDAFRDTVASLFRGLGRSTEDGAATLTAFTARAIARSREHMPDEPRLWIIAGGGRKNRVLMAMLAERVHNAVVPAEAVGLDGDAIEAEAWAYLAVRSLEGLAITFPGTTGAPRPLTGGRLAKA